MNTLTFKPSTYKLVLTALFSAVVLAGCATNTPYIDEHFGEAVNAAKAQQTINPDASLNTDPVAGVDGQVADAAVDRYHKSFVQPPVTTNVFNIGVGTGSGGVGTGAGGVVR
ncbi:MAG: hypothetical protein Q7U70_08260 [Methylotenera sp.]|nr:hypothetical protein [Methylotenera sp.]MDO9388756.1 hypothetical protein [Methylotenera sp.]